MNDLTMPMHPWHFNLQSHDNQAVQDSIVGIHNSLEFSHIILHERIIWKMSKMGQVQIALQSYKFLNNSLSWMLPQPNNGIVLIIIAVVSKEKQNSAAVIINSSS